MCYFLYELPVSQQLAARAAIAAPLGKGRVAGAQFLLRQMGAGEPTAVLMGCIEFVLSDAATLIGLNVFAPD